MRQASGTIAPSKSAYSIADGGPALVPVPTEVTPSRSRTGASYCRFSMRRSCVVAGMPGAHVRLTLPPLPAEPLPLPAPPPEPGPWPPPALVGRPLPTLPVQPSKPAASNPQRLLRRKCLMLPNGSRAVEPSVVAGRAVSVDEGAESPRGVAGAVLLHQPIDARLVAARIRGLDRQHQRLLAQRAPRMAGQVAGQQLPGARGVVIAPQRHHR